MPINETYRTWIRRICELRPGQRITQVRNFVWLMVGIFHSRSVQLSQVASKIPGQAQNLSTVRRLSRFLDNPAIQVREWYEPIARQWLEAQYCWIGEIRLIVDGTKVGFGHQLLMVSLAYRRRAIPIAWTWVKQFVGIARVVNSWLSCTMSKDYFLENRPFFWSVTVNLARFWCCDSSINGIGSMFCARKGTRVSGTTSRQTGKS